jgi:hypothetical protein
MTTIFANPRQSSMGIISKKKRGDETLSADFETCLQKFNIVNMKGQKSAITDAINNIVENKWLH